MDYSFLIPNTKDEWYLFLSMIIGLVAAFTTFLFFTATVYTIYISNSSLKEVKKQLIIQEKETREKNLHSNIEFQNKQIDNYYLPLYFQLYGLQISMDETFILLTKKDEKYRVPKMDLRKHIDEIMKIGFHSSLCSRDVNELMLKSTNPNFFKSQVLELPNLPLELIEIITHPLFEKKSVDNFQDYVLLLNSLVSHFFYIEYGHFEENIEDWNKIRIDFFHI